MKKVALFGGSFNPIHRGHLQIARELLERKIVEEVWLIPCGNHAFGKELAPSEHRLEMIKRAIKHDPTMKIETYEIRRKEKSYTSATIEFLKKKYSHDFLFVLGGDNVKDLARWHNLAYLCNAVSFILVARPGSVIPSLNIPLAHIVNIQNTASSTCVRQRLKKKLSIKHLVPEAVEKYIRNEELYLT